MDNVKFDTLTNAFGKATITLAAGGAGVNLLTGSVEGMNVLWTLASASFAATIFCASLKDINNANEGLDTPVRPAGPRASSNIDDCAPKK